jgi:hypothetical protein
MRTGDFHPATAVADIAQQALETRRAGAGARIGAAHVVDQHRQADRIQDWNRLRHILAVDPELQVPADVLHLRR